ncbi:hypothetical protein K470DRAFT_257387 [Piedraia hortae CBS 480.64]|uniref:Protein BCP1 n=1 Tax=Piedraia hortae CBS 480.64 TaxID=1314780 RepID=A0A6A7C163_9PEZI|nr:hypothetical protein K470DRAFT_257387 [Piedraia hortae CBS 480.64]
MSKRAQASSGAEVTEHPQIEGIEDGETIIDVEFEWFDPQPAVDFHGLKTLLRQLFDTDNEKFNLSELVDMILAQPTLGSTVKAEGNESDPFAFLTVLNMQQLKDKEVMGQLREYFLARAGHVNGLEEVLENADARIGLVLGERFINMPHQVVPPMYDMLLEEIGWANGDGEEYDFTHYLVVSKTYTEVESELATEDRPQKKRRKETAANMGEFYFHPEDEVFHRFAAGFGSYDYENQGESDAKRTFQELGVKPTGHLIIVDAKKFPDAVKAVGEFLKVE